jgi:hypothetical protein
MNWHVPHNLKNRFIAGFTFNQTASQNLCPRYQQRFNLSELSDNTSLFLNLDHFEYFFEHLQKSGFGNKFILITHNSDRDFTQKMYDLIERYVTKIYAVNCTAVGDKIKKIPLGFNDQSTEILDKMDMTFEEKNELIYVNFKLHHHSERPICLNYFKLVDWASIEPQLIPQEDYYKKAKNFKYSVCPRGTGIDTHRIYESLLFGVIPIVKSGELDDLYNKLPIVIVKDWSDITFEFLNDNYDKFLKNYFTWLENNKNWYEPEYWLN